VLLQLGSSDLFARHNFVVLNGSDRRRDRSGSMIAVGGAGTAGRSSDELKSK